MPPTKRDKTTFNLAQVIYKKNKGPAGKGWRRMRRSDVDVVVDALDGTAQRLKNRRELLATVDHETYVQVAAANERHHLSTRDISRQSPESAHQMGTKDGRA